MVFYFWNSILLFTKSPQIEKEGKQYLNIDVRNSKRRLNGIFGIVGGIVFLIVGIKMNK